MAVPQEETLDSSYGLLVPDESAEQGQLLAEPGPVPLGSPAQRSNQRPQSYLWSSQFYELLVCLSYALIIGAVLLPFKDRPHQRPIPYEVLENSGDIVRNLNYNEVSVETETVPVWALRLCSLVLPLTIQLLLCLLGEDHMSDMHATVCVYTVAMTTNALATVFVKLYVGYLRPIFYDLCQPDDNYQACTTAGNQSQTLRMSFPSGHASESFCGLTLLMLYVHTRFGVASQRGCGGGGVYALPPCRRPDDSGIPLTATTGTWPRETRFIDIRWARLVSMLAMLLPMGLALFISTSRVVDNKHFPADIVCGSLLGASISRYVYGLWFE